MRPQCIEGKGTLFRYRAKDLGTEQRIQVQSKGINKRKSQDLSQFCEFLSDHRNGIHIQIVINAFLHMLNKRIV